LGARLVAALAKTIVEEGNLAADRGILKGATKWAELIRGLAIHPASVPLNVNFTYTKSQSLWSILIARKATRVVGFDKCLFMPGAVESK
jgi:hypothetical protein